MPFIKRYETSYLAEQRNRVKTICDTLNSRALENKHEQKLYGKLLHELVKERNLSMYD